MNKLIWICIASSFLFYGFLAGRYLFPKVEKQEVVMASPTKTDGLLTGMKVWDEVNNYRKQRGLKEMSLNEVICNNIIARWSVLKSQTTSTDPHKGYEEERVAFNKLGYQVGELYGFGDTSKEVVDAWSNSPSHKIWLESKKTTTGCAYGNGDFAILLSGYPN